MLFENIMDEKLRNAINETINALYIDCKDENGKFNQDLFLRISKMAKEKISIHVENVIDIYSKL